MNTLLFLIGLFIVIVFAGSYLIVIWNKEKQKQFSKQLNESISKTVDIVNKTIKDMQNITDNFKKENDKLFLQNSLEIKLNADKKKEKVNQEMIDRLVNETNMTREDAIKLVKENIK